MTNGRKSPEISIMNPIRFVHLDPTRRFTASGALEIHWQLALTRRGSPPKILFYNSP